MVSSENGEKQSSFGRREGSAPFSSTGPAGHRKRMRVRVLNAGAASLADYELLEMLLFPGVPRRDTKPLAKALINQFGSLADVLEAAPEALKEAGATRGNVALLGLVPLAADRLGAPDDPVRADLGSWDKLLTYCATHLVTAEAGALHVLFLDSRNQLLADEVVETQAGEASGGEDAPIPVPQVVSAIMQRALALHACSLITVRLAGDDVQPDRQLLHDGPLVQALLQAAPLLAVTMHDHVVLKGRRWRSFRHLEQQAW
ncbi:MAG: JAB domain-containing protein [Acetobacter malorum]|uniref:JAB domain-containing protein n=2 Tax=Acetobacter malorum TaxID=178901 RepID=UPI0039ED467B